MPTRHAQSIPAYRADALSVVNGANLGDTLGTFDDIQPDDIYHLGHGQTRQRLALIMRTDGALVVAEGSELGAVGNIVHLDCNVTFMATDGSTADCIVGVEVDAEGMIETVLAIPLHTFETRRDYRVIGINREEARRQFARIACVSFTRGTRITMATGAQKRIEDIAPGDMVLTRDAGAQAVRWIGQTTMKAEGSFAPILIKAGTLNNAADLLVSPDHRLFIYQRQDTIGAGRSELLVRAQHLVNGETVLRRSGGYVDYFQILFDEHQILYAEGIAAESLLVDTRTRPALPKALAEQLAETRHGRDTGLRADFEVSEMLTRRPDAAELLRRASTR